MNILPSVATMPPAPLRPPAPTWNSQPPTRPQVRLALPVESSVQQRALAWVAQTPAWVTLGCLVSLVAWCLPYYSNVHLTTSDNSLNDSTPIVAIHVPAMHGAVTAAVVVAVFAAASTLRRVPGRGYLLVLASVGEIGYVAGHWPSEALITVSPSGIGMTVTPQWAAYAGLLGIAIAVGAAIVTVIVDRQEHS